MEIHFLSHAAEEIIELVNMVIAFGGGIAALFLLTMINGEIGKSWKLIAIGVFVFAVSEFFGGYKILFGAKELVGISVKTYYHGIQTLFILIILAGIIQQVKTFAKAVQGGE